MKFETNSCNGRTNRNTETQGNSKHLENQKLWNWQKYYKQQNPDFFCMDSMKEWCWTLRFYFSSCHENSCNSLNFWDRGLIFWFSLIFVDSKNHILKLIVSVRFLNDLIFYTPLPNGGWIKYLNSNLVQNFCFKNSEKVKKLWFNIYMH